MNEFAEVTPVYAARNRLLDLVAPVERTETLALADADGRVAAATVTAGRAIPHYERAATDGFAVRARDTTAASGRTPVHFDVGERVEPSVAVAVDTGQQVPQNADAVLPIEAAEPDDRNGSDGSEGAVLVAESVPPEANVAPVGEDVAVGEVVVERGERIGPAHLGLLRGVGVESVEVSDRPTVAIVPTGEELVAVEPKPGEIVETNSLVVGRHVDRWGGTVERRDPVPDEPEEHENALEAGLDADLVVTLGGTSVGERDCVPAAVDSLGEMVVHGVGFRPGRSVGFGVVEETPVITLPGRPVGCLVAAHLFLRPAIATAGHLPMSTPPTTDATLERKIASDLGTRTYARVTLDTAGDGPTENGTPTATPLRAKGSGILSSVADADGWVVVSESAEGIPAGETVTVEHWEALSPFAPPDGRAGAKRHASREGWP